MESLIDRISKLERAVEVVFSLVMSMETELAVLTGEPMGDVIASPEAMTELEALLERYRRCRLDPAIGP